MWTKKEKPKTVQVTKALVKEFFEMEPTPRDRLLSERRLMVYERVLADGEFRPVTWASAWCEETQCQYRVNGKHTSTMLSRLDVLPEFFVTIERYECPTLDDVARLYATFDTRIGVRSAGDIILSFAGAVKEFDGLKKKTFMLAVGAAAYHEWGLGFHSHHAAERAELLHDNIEFTVWLDGILWPKTGEQRQAAHTWRLAVATAMLATFARCRKDSDAFWLAVRDETEPNRDSPTRKLARYLSRNTVHSTMTTPQGKQIVSFREMYVKCLHAWNAWRSQAETDLKYYPQAKIPSAK